jgi:hypothetical protein
MTVTHRIAEQTITLLTGSIHGVPVVMEKHSTCSRVKRTYYLDALAIEALKVHHSRKHELMQLTWTCPEAFTKEVATLSKLYTA